MAAVAASALLLSLCHAGVPVSVAEVGNKLRAHLPFRIGF